MGAWSSVCFVDGEWLASRLFDFPTSRLVDIVIDLGIPRFADWRSGCLVDGSVAWWIECLSGMEIDWASVDRFAACLLDWLIDWPTD